jgi:hypothetical protein
VLRLSFEDAYFPLELPDPHRWLLLASDNYHYYCHSSLLESVFRFSTSSSSNSTRLLSSPSASCIFPGTMQFAHSLLSGALLLLPVAVTLAIYIGINTHQIFHSGFKGSYGIPNNVPKFGINTYCQKSIGITPQNGRYTCKFVPAVASPCQRGFSLAWSVVGFRFILRKTFQSEVGASIRSPLESVGRGAQGLHASSLIFPGYALSQRAPQPAMQRTRRETMIQQANTLMHRQSQPMGPQFERTLCYVHERTSSSILWRLTNCN